MKNFAIIIPESFTTTWESCVVYVHFEFYKKWGEFKVWVKEGNLKQCTVDGNIIDVWVRRNTDLHGDEPASLQEHFNNFCKPPQGYSYKSFKIKNYAKEQPIDNPDDIGDTTFNGKNGDD